MVKQTNPGNTMVNKLTPGACHIMRMLPCTVTAGICVLLFLKGLSLITICFKQGPGTFGTCGE